MKTNIESLEALDIVVVVYNVISEGILGTIHLYGQPTMEEIEEHVQSCHTGYEFEIVNILK